MVGDVVPPGQLNEPVYENLKCCDRGCKTRLLRSQKTTSEIGLIQILGIVCKQAFEVCSTFRNRALCFNKNSQSGGAEVFSQPEAPTPLQ